MPEKNIASHIASIVAFASAILAAIHPGFTMNPNVSVWATTALLAAAGVIQVVNTFFHSSNSAKLAVVRALAEKAANDLGVVATTQVPTQAQSLAGTSVPSPFADPPAPTTTATMPVMPSMSVTTDPSVTVLPSATVTDPSVPPGA